MTVQDWLGADNKIGIDIWERKYRHEDETFEDWLIRVSGGDEQVIRLILDKRFLPGGRILANRNLDKKGVKVTLSNCYVITPPEDNIESIFDAAKKLGRTFSYGGGCGIDIGKLRPRGAAVNNTAKESSGAVSFMELYNTTTGTIGQGGRRGALMISIPVDHPDVEEFITAKGNADKLTNANISIRVSDKFMRAVLDDEDFDLQFEGKVYKTVKAKELFHKFCENNWNYAEPGLLFWDTIESQNLLEYDPDFSYAGTNPCAEEPLPAGGSCLLGSMNLSEYVYGSFTEMADFDYEGFKYDVGIAVRCLNDILDEGLPLHPLEEQRKSVRDWRQIGLGIMGFADCLIKLGITYGSNEAYNLAENLSYILFCAAVKSSEALGYDLGSYPNFKENEINSSNMLGSAGLNVKSLRNSQLLTIAPTGTLSTMLGISGGIEPIFANSYTRKTQSLHKEEKIYKVYTPIVERYMKENNITDEKDLPEYFITAPEIKPIDRINMQEAWQTWIDASISSTINLPNSATVEDIEQIYIDAWLNDLKGVTIYRAGCAREGVLVTEETKKMVTGESETKNTTPELKRGDILVVDNNVIGLKRKLQTGCGSLHVQAYFDPQNGTLQEVYLSKGSTGGCNNFMIGLSRTISLLARAGVAIEDIVDQLNSTGVCASYAVRSATHKDTSKGSCCPMAIGQALLSMSNEMADWLWNSDGRIDFMQTPEKTKPKQKNKINKCPQCGEELIQEGGCIICKSCGWSKCD